MEKKEKRGKGRSRLGLGRCCRCRRMKVEECQRETNAGERERKRERRRERKGRHCFGQTRGRGHYCCRRLRGWSPPSGPSSEEAVAAVCREKRSVA
ncbi:uncharacterized protein DS421_15g505070 [Arachis hypogaea]|nr:uncharacterized protein DS421_15g505070 [Arachis hypogaea]